MTSFDKLRFGLDIALGIQERNPQYNIAVLMKQTQPNKAPQIVGVGSHPTGLDAWSTHTAIVNAIQGVKAGLGNILVFSTYPPTVACKGMMRTHKLNSVTYNALPSPRYMPIGERKWAALLAEDMPAKADCFHLPNTFPSIPTQIGMRFDGLEALAGRHHDFTTLWKTSWDNFKNKLSTARRISQLQRYVGMGGGFSQNFVDTVYMLFAYTVAGRVWNENAGLSIKGARIAAVLGNPQGTIYGWQVNARKIGTTFHAETNLVQGIGKIPDDATLYTTLEPCQQCAGLYVQATGQRCIYGQPDPNIESDTALGATATPFGKSTFQTVPSSPPISPGDRMQQVMVELKETRVLNMLDQPLSLEVYSQSERVLKALIAISRSKYADGHPKRLFIENFAKALKV